MVINMEIVEALEKEMGCEVTPIFAIFFDMLPERIKAVRQAETDSDLDAMHQQVHPLKSSSLQLGMESLAAAATKLDDQCRVDKLAETLALLPAFYHEAELAKEALDKMLNQG